MNAETIGLCGGLDAGRITIPGASVSRRGAAFSFVAAIL
jgi:hypothetical protein